MERLRIYCGARDCGEATLRADGERVEIRAGMEDPGDGLYRAVLIGTAGQLALGVMEPAAGQLALKRRPAQREVERLGKLLRVQTECSFPFRKGKVWQQTEKPSQLVKSEFLMKRLAECHRCWWRREEEQLILALPWGEGERFPLESLFCFGRVSMVEGCRCVIYTLDSAEVPL